MPEGFKLAGDYHITRGGNTVIGGPPGIGKSRAALQLAFCGVTGEDWLGLPVHAQFKTYILQNENGLHRLKADFDDAPSGLDEFVRIRHHLTLGCALKSRSSVRHSRRNWMTSSPAWW